MQNRIDQTFSALRSKNEKAFVAYVCAGDPSFEKSIECIRGLADAGADIIELGVPFSDPLADGIVNQMAAERALASGMTTSLVLELVKEFRRTHETPIVLFTYLNPIYSYGYKAFFEDAEGSGVDGILLLDLPPDEAKHHTEFAIESSLKTISLIAPNTPDTRVQELSEKSEGFLYALSRTGVTGSHGGPAASVAETVERIKKYTRTPVCVGFGIATAEQAALVAGQADGVVVGSAIVSQIEANLDSPVSKVVEFVTPLIAAVKSKAPL